MIIASKNEELNIYIQVEQLYIEEYGEWNIRSPSGLFNFIIDDIFYPGKGVIHDLLNTMDSLIMDIKKYVINGNMPDIGKMPLSKMVKEERFYSQDPLDTGILMLCSAQYGFYLGFDGKEERFFFGEDINDITNVQERRYPKGTIASLIMALPDIWVKNKKDKLVVEITEIGEVNRMVTLVKDIKDPSDPIKFI